MHHVPRTNIPELGILLTQYQCDETAQNLPLDSELEGVPRSQHQPTKGRVHSRGGQMAPTSADKTPAAGVLTRAAHLSVHRGENSGAASVHRVTLTQVAQPRTLP